MSLEIANCPFCMCEAGVSESEGGYIVGCTGIPAKSGDGTEYDPEYLGENEEGYTPEELEELYGEKTT
jgi:hypothetical protein